MKVNFPQPAPEPIDPVREERVARIRAAAEDRRARRKAKHKPKVFQIDLRKEAADLGKARNLPAKGVQMAARIMKHRKDRGMESVLEIQRQANEQHSALAGQMNRSAIILGRERSAFEMMREIMRPVEPE